MKLFKSALLVGATLCLAMSANAQEHLYSVNPQGFDNTVAPGVDFYQHVNKGWMEDHPLTPEYARYGVFNILNDSSNNRIRRIINNLEATNPKKGSVAYKVNTLYRTSLDSVRRNNEGNLPIVPIIKKIENTPASGMADLFLLIQKEYAAPFYSVGFDADLNNSNIYTMFVAPPSLGMGDRDYYLENDKNNTKIRTAYVKMIRDLMKLSGFNNKEAKRIADNVLKIETEAAKVARTREESRDLLAMNNPRTLEELKQELPNFPWDTFFTETMGFDTPQNYIITDPKALAHSDQAFANTTDREKKDYYLWLVIRGAAPYLSDAYADAVFNYNKVKSGVSQMPPRWKRALNNVQDHLGEAIGQLYVEEYFPQSSKEYMVGLVENLRNALGKHIMHLSWMSDDTKLQAIKKLNAITVKIGYPDKWKDYTGMDLDQDLSFYDNMRQAMLWEIADYNKKWGKPVDKTEWQMTPQTINAYYNPLYNEIVFPAGILQAPFFDPKSSDAENYGAIGVVIGHELTHGFDDQGCLFDAEGNMVNWWTPEDSEAFKNLTQGLVAQFDEVQILPDLKANGSYTLGENIADHGGLRIGLTAFLDSQKKKGVDINSPEAKIDGFTPMQVFYLNYANIWAQNQREEEIRNLTMNDVHSLGKNRVNVSLRNITPFFEAFDIQETDPLFRPESERITIW